MGSQESSKTHQLIAFRFDRSEGWPDASLENKSPVEILNRFLIGFINNTAKFNAKRVLILFYFCGAGFSNFQKKKTVKTTHHL
jgi:hypothetical protein